MTVTRAQLDNWFSYHPPTPRQREEYEEIRASAIGLAADMVLWRRLVGIDSFAALLMRLCPAGDELSCALDSLNLAEDVGREDMSEGEREDAIRHLRNAVMWANAAIACAEPNEKGFV